MRKWWVIPVLAALLFSLTGPTALAAGSASATISGVTKVERGKTYTYTVKVTIKNSTSFVGKITYSGIFTGSVVQLPSLDSDGTNKSTTITKKVSLKIPSNAKIGSTGIITVTGFSSYMTGDGNVGDNPNTSKSITVTVVATAPSTPKPSTSATKKPTAKPTGSPSPTATPEPNEWDTALQSAASLTTGGSLNVDVAKTAQMPAQLLSSLKDKQGKLTVNLGGYTCAIDGATLAGVPAEGIIDLSMSMEKDAALSQKAGGADLYQMKFAHTGALPGPFAYTFKAEQSKPGDTLYLYYYYDAAGVLEGLQSAKVDDAGNVTFSIYHCSAYIVTAAPIEGAAGSLADAAAARLEAQDAQGKLTEAQTQLSTEKEGKSQLEGQLTEAQGKAAQLEGQLKDYQDIDAANQARAAGTLTAPYIVFIGGAAAVAVVSILLTVLICRKGNAKKKDEVKTGV